ncbi:3-hydroxyacyl-CoA dehydrogenase NAD-binding domain-containing protein, partial [Eubacteriales bacterium DFI.9.88]|nr:3-hydroxyacyl-CoA dehydrogenase NAD-binding domain-containing protein [Eubacteriales bacterium DFI.9.88]
GTMGAGIIQVLAQNGYEVVLRARRQTSVDNGLATVTKNLDKMAKKEKITAADKDEILSRVHGSTDISIVKDADLIIEAATEDMEAKKALFQELDEL